MRESNIDILQWIEQRRVHAGAVPAALRSAGVWPDAAGWRHFFDRLTLWLGTVFCAAAVIFFFAYNWQAMGRFAKFGLVETIIVLSLLFCWRLDLDRIAGKAVLLLATLLVGALLALVGQTYQTGADTYELFAAWALAVLPWVAVGRFGALWLVWLALLNLAATFYFQAFPGMFGWIFSPERRLWALFALNTAALVTWEAAARAGADWLRERWPVRIVATASGAMVTVLMTWAVIDAGGPNLSFAVLAYALWMAAAFAWYRHLRPDVFALAGGVLSLIIVTTAFLSKHLLRHSDAGGFLLIGVVVIMLSAVGGLWLKSVANEERA